VTPVERVNGFAGWIGERIKGQPEVVSRLEAHIARSELSLTDQRYVRGAFLFVGPTGVGKTETTLCASEYLFGLGSCARFNMAEFKAKENVMELRERLAKARRAGKRVFLVDEIEKAHWEILDLMLQIFDKGAAMTAPDGEELDFCPCYFVMTSNLGAREAMRSRTQNYTSFSNTILEYVKRSMRPELLGRIYDVGAVLVFRKLGEPEQRAIARSHVEAVCERLRGQGARIEITAGAFEYIMRHGFSEEYGARHLRGCIAAAIEGAVSTAQRRGLSGSGVLELNASGDALELRASENAAA